MEVFPFKYRFEIPEEQEFTNTVVQFQSKKKQVRGGTTIPQKKWQITLYGDNELRLALLEFHKRHYGDLKTFYFETPDRELVEARFASGKLQIKTKREPGGNVVGYESEVIIEKVI